MLLSRTFRPGEDLAPYIRRYYIFEAELPDEMVIEDFLLSETAFIRILLDGDWKGEVEPGVWDRPSDTLLFGANERPFPVRVKGSFKVLGIAIRPCGWKALFPWPHHKFRDNLFPLSELWGDLATTMEAELKAADGDDAIIACMEDTIRTRLAQVGTRETDDAMAQLEAIARTDSKMLVEEVAARANLSTRQLERRCRDTFGLTPKAVLRRSRFLDMATAMRGFSSPSETDLAALRYFDQSHLNKEFKRFTRMTPKQFEKAVTPLQTAGLKLREESLYED
ncbi:helix-turn-helix domain-containing protein [Qipengyuania sp. DSG2-2]|uniref:helix-turn-helix domain-containing protein n=1 Tax=Qipengyuania sp. DGS2-2 TaxID=3349631 RepID=UPI0036D33DA4